MHLLSITALALLATTPILAQDVDNEDIPTQCATVCNNIATVSNDCDRAFNNDNDERQCMCQAQGAQQVIPLCAACITFVDTQNDPGDDDNGDNDVSDLVRACSFSTTTYDPSMTYSQAAMTAATSLSSTASGSRTTLTGSQATSNSPVATVTSAINSAASAASNAASAASSAASAATNAGNVGARPPAAVEGVGALAGAALLVAAAWI